MAQPAGFLSQDNGNDMDIPVFWTSANSDPPWKIQISFDQFLLPVKVTENVNADTLMEDPKPVKEGTVPRPETARTGEDAQAVTDREARNRLARDRALLENKERKERVMCITTKFKNGLLRNYS